MKSTIAVSLLLAVASADAFPANDPWHSHCQMKTTFTGSCDEVFAGLDKTVKNIQDPGKGIYAVHEEVANKSIWSTRTTPAKHYVDDQLFEISSGNDTQCAIVAKTRSRTYSYYDYDTNYCNLWNIFRFSGMKFTEPVIEDCRWQPSIAFRESICNKY